MAQKKIPVIDYCKEAMELHLAKLSERDIDLIAYNLAKVIHGVRNDVDITMHRMDSDGKPQAVKIPSKAFLRTDKIRNELKSIGISDYKIDQYLKK
jgi:hypothetical protein